MIHDPDKVLEFIKKYKVEGPGDSPTRRQIADALEISSTNTVQYILKGLEKKGKIRLVGRRIEVVGGKWVFEEKATYEA